ncbi:MAG: DEAD/DEAH box helicase family protein [Candidatus Delongbacteria bacterium]|nr:DEAD/DEAH box helicase family protein [Candidatus Delongbacteria bacterium]
MYISEAQTRKEIIDKRLKMAGWDARNSLQVTQEFDIYTKSPFKSNEQESKYQGHLFADYALLSREHKPLAIVEAKKTSVDAEIGKEQARNYAENIYKNNNGKMPFIFYTNGYDIFFWDSERYPPRKVIGFPTIADFERIQFLRENNKFLSSERIKTNIAGRPYQIQAIRAVLEKIENKHRKFLLVMATGTGKTRTCIGLLDVLMRSNWVQKVLFLVDRIALKEQALEAFKEFLPNAPLWPKTGEVEFIPNRRIYCTTYPSMLNLIQQENCPVSPFYFDMIIADESHRSIYNVYQSIFEYFDAIQLGLTATPTDAIDHNTFHLFDCEVGLPAFAYSYEEAIDNIPPYLSDFEVLKIRTKYQQEGINSSTIAEAEKNRLIKEGENPDELNFEGTDLEKRVTNKGTNAVIVREFMEECIKDPNGVLPGKTIFFSISKKHAHRLCTVFDALYPEYKGQLAEVIISEAKGVHGKGGILNRFKTKDMPRIAISVDMLDTGIDIREIVNLVFAKPVFSYTKFWQMIGRGTRVLDPTNIKPWCPQKDKFLIMDCWENFEYFKMTPRGKEPNPTVPLPVRLFNTRIDKLGISLKKNNLSILEKTIKAIRKDITELPKYSVVILDNQQYLEKVMDENFWIQITNDKLDYLRLHISPLMRVFSNTDFKAMHFKLDILETQIAILLDDRDKFEVLKDTIIEKVSELPLSVNIVAKEKEWIETTQSNHFWIGISDDDLDKTADHLAHLMKFRQPRVTLEKKLNIQDLLTVKEVVEFGPQHERMTVDKYRKKVEEFIYELQKTNPVLQKIVRGENVSDEEIKKLADILKEQYPHVTEYILREIYDNQSAKFVQFIKHILGIEEVATFAETVSIAFDDFLRNHNNYGEKQIQFLLTLKTFVLQRGIVKKRDLIEAPFTQLHPEGIRGVFKPQEINEILELTQKIAV